jgi:hypothetical protein
MDLVDRLASALLEREGVEEGRSRFGHEVAFRFRGLEFLHLHGEDEVDVRLGRAAIRSERARLTADPRVRLPEVPSDWVTVPLERPADVEVVLALADRAIGRRA